MKRVRKASPVNVLVMKPGSYAFVDYVAVDSDDSLTFYSNPGPVMD